MSKLLPLEVIASKIILIRNEKVLLDRDLAELYGVETKQLKRAVRRNINRFPKDFMFELSVSEMENLRYQFGTSSWGGTRYVPMVFTEQGVSMLSSVLNSDRAIEVNIAIMRTFVQLRKMASSHRQLSEKIDKLEQKYDHQFRIVFKALKELMTPPEKPKRRIGF